MSAQLKISERLAFKPSPTGYSDVLERSLPPALDDSEEHILYHRSICVFTGIHKISGSRYCSRHLSQITVMDSLSKIHGSVLTEETVAEAYTMKHW